MKKVFLGLAVVSSLMLVSCFGKETQTEPTEPVETVEGDTPEVIDSTAEDTGTTVTGETASPTATPVEEVKPATEAVKEVKETVKK